MSFNNDKILPALGMMTAESGTFTMPNLTNIKFNDSDNSNFTYTPTQDIGSRSFVKLRFTRADELDLNSAAVRIGESSDSTRIGLIGGNYSGTNNVFQRAYSDNKACDVVDHVLNITLVDTNDNTQNIEVTNNTVMLMWRF